MHRRVRLLVIAAVLLLGLTGVTGANSTGGKACGSHMILHLYPVSHALYLTSPIGDHVVMVQQVPGPSGYVLECNCDL